MIEDMTLEEISAWLEALDYDEFWEEIDPYCPEAGVYYRLECEEAIKGGHMSKNEALQFYRFWTIEAFASVLDPTYDADRRGIFIDPDNLMRTRH